MSQRMVGFLEVVLELQKSVLYAQIFDVIWKEVYCLKSWFLINIAWLYNLSLWLLCLLLLIVHIYLKRLHQPRYQWKFLRFLLNFLQFSLKSQKFLRINNEIYALTRQTPGKSRFLVKHRETPTEVLFSVSIPR